MMFFWKRDKTTAPEFLVNYVEKSIKFNNKDFGDVKINYAISKNWDENKQTIMFMHGLSNNWIAWIPVADQLIDNFNIVLIDMPGFGKSTKFNQYSVTRLSSIIQDFLKVMPEKVNSIVAHCASSSVAYDIAYHFGEDTDIKFFFVSLPESYFAKKRVANWMAMTGLFLASRIFFLDSIWRYLLTTKLIRKFLTKYINTYKNPGTKSDKYGTYGIREMDSKAWVDLAIDISRYQFRDHPLQKKNKKFIYGRHDKVAFEQSWIQYLKDNDYDLTILEEVGHLPQVEATDACVQIISETLTQEKS